MPHFSCSVFSRCIKFSHNVEAKLPNPLCLIRNNRTNFDELRYIVCVARIYFWRVPCQGTQCLVSWFPKCGSSHGLFRLMQAFYGTKLPSSWVRWKKHPVAVLELWGSHNICVVSLWFCALKMEARGSSEPFESVNYPTRHRSPLRRTFNFVHQ